MVCSHSAKSSFMATRYSSLDLNGRKDRASNRTVLIVVGRGDDQCITCRLTVRICAEDLYVYDYCYRQIVTLDKLINIR
jgi:hypothetical protein